MYDVNHLKNRQSRLTIDSIEEIPGNAEVEEDSLSNELNNNQNEKKAKEGCLTTRAQPR